MIGVEIKSPEQWHALRARNIGASEVSALFDCNPYVSRYALWQQKAGNAPDSFQGSERTRWGLRLEEAIAAACCEEMGDIRGPAERCGYVESHAVPGMGCTPDFVVDSDAGPVLLEVKNVDWLVNKRTWGDEPPMHILLQLQHQLACTGLDSGIVAALVGGNELRHWRFDRRPKVIAEIERRVVDFWASIDAGDEPPIDGHPTTLAAVKAMLPAEHGDNSAIELHDDEFAVLCDEIQAGKEAIRATESGIRAAQARLLKMMGGAQTAYGLGWRAKVLEFAATPDRVARDGEVIKGRAGSVRLQVKEIGT